MRMLPAIILGLLLNAAPLSAAPPGARSPRPAAAEPVGGPGGPPPSQVIFELGWAVPGGDLGEDFAGDELGFGADDGMQAGFRWRLHVSEHFSLSPAFHFTDYGNFSGTDADLGEYRVECTTYGYTVEALWRTSGRSAAVRPFLAVAAGLYRNRVVGFTKTFERSFDESVNTFGYGLRAGFAASQLEFSVVYNVNRFSTWRYFATGVDQAYDWDTLVVRGGWSIPFGG